METAKQIELKPCPFCGGTAEQPNPRLPHGGMVRCVSCGAEAFGPKWNRRTEGEPQRCPCTMFEQDEDCPEGYPSMLCGICKGTGNTTQEQVTALAVEMLKIASDVGEPEDPFAAWESIDLARSAANKAPT